MRVEVWLRTLGLWLRIVSCESEAFRGFRGGRLRVCVCVSLFCAALNVGFSGSFRVSWSRVLGSASLRFLPATTDIRLSA